MYTYSNDELRKRPGNTPSTTGITTISNISVSISISISITNVIVL